MCFLVYRELMTENQEQKKMNIWEVNWTEQMELDRMNFTNVVILDNTKFYLFTFGCCNLWVFVFLNPRPSVLILVPRPSAPILLVLGPQNIARLNTFFQIGSFVISNKVVWRFNGETFIKHSVKLVPSVKLLFLKFCYQKSEH